MRLVTQYLIEGVKAPFFISLAITKPNTYIRSTINKAMQEQVRSFDGYFFSETTHIPIFSYQSVSYPVACRFVYIRNEIIEQWMHEN